MGSLRGEKPAGQRGSEGGRDEPEVRTTEMSLADYFRVIWKRRRFILIVSVLPSLITGLVIHVWPRKYRVTYTYDIRLDEKGYKMLLDKFYSEENLARLNSRLKEEEHGWYARELARASRKNELKKVIGFRVSPRYFEVLNTAKRINVGEVEEIQQVRGTLLTMTITGRPQKDMERICSIVRDDFEWVVPMYSVQHQLRRTIAQMKGAMGNIEERKYGLKLELERKKETSRKLKELKPEDSEKIPGGIVLQFDNVGEDGKYLPVAYQIQVSEANIVRLEETIRADEENYAYYKGLLGLNETVLGEIRGSTSSYYTVKEFHSFLGGIADGQQAEELKDYLNAYIKSIENMMSEYVPIVEKPNMYPVAKYVAKKTMIVFLALLAATTFAAFLFEGIKGKAPEGP
jgi:hypothetical protein